MRVYAFDIDDTLIKRNTLYFSSVHKHPEFYSIEDSMLNALEHGDAIWIVTANWIYTKNCTRKLFRYPELYECVQFFNGYDIASYIGVPQAVPFVWDIHFQGLKAHFIFRKLIEMDLRKPHHLQKMDLLECILYDDTRIQITQ